MSKKLLLTPPPIEVELSLTNMKNSELKGYWVKVNGKLTVKGLKFGYKILIEWFSGRGTFYEFLIHDNDYTYTKDGTYTVNIQIGCGRTIGSPANAHVYLMYGDTKYGVSELDVPVSATTASISVKSKKNDLNFYFRDEYGDDGYKNILQWSNDKSEIEKVWDGLFDTCKSHNYLWEVLVDLNPNFEDDEGLNHFRYLEYYDYCDIYKVTLNPNCRYFDINPNFLYEIVLKESQYFLFSAFEGKKEEFFDYYHNFTLVFLCLFKYGDYNEWEIIPATYESTIDRAEVSQDWLVKELPFYCNYITETYDELCDYFETVFNNSRDCTCIALLTYNSY